jgi:hypothetical protein
VLTTRLVVVVVAVPEADGPGDGVADGRGDGVADGQDAGDGVADGLAGDDGAAGGLDPAPTS